MPPTATTVAAPPAPVVEPVRDTRDARNPIIGIWLLADARGRGIGSSAQRQLVDLFFRHTPTNGVEAGTDRGR